MARPQKNNCDYFPHDNDMRNHVKVRAIRNKFANGYAIWSMLLEFLTGSDGNTFEKTPLQMELLSGDFGVSVTEMSDVVDYCIKLELLFEKDGWIYSESLNERLAPVYEKRGKSKQLSAKQQRVNGKFAGNNTDSTGVSAAETPQIKVNKIKEKDSKEYKKVLLSEIEISDFPEIDNNHLLIAKEFQNLFRQNLIDAGAATINVDKAKGTWIDDVRLIYKDGYTLEDIRAVYKFLQTNDFWKKNILSTSKLREKFDKLKLEIKHGTGRKNYSAVPSEQEQLELSAVVYKHFGGSQ